MCGLDEQSMKDDDLAAAPLLGSLEQSATEKRWLSVALFVIMSIGCSMYIYWSV